MDTAEDEQEFQFGNQEGEEHRQNDMAGTGTVPNDIVDTRVCKKFGYPLPRCALLAGHLFGAGGHRLKRSTAVVLAFQLAEAHAAAAALRVAALWVGHGKAAADHGGHALEREGGRGGAAAALAAAQRTP